MAPTFRSSRSGRQFTETANRSRTAEHDIFEGLPIRRWTRQNHTVSQDAKMDIPDNTGDNVKVNQPFPELPMPKDSHLLAPHSRALLRAARAGYIYLLPATKDTQTTDEREANENDESTPVSKMERSYTTRKWTQIPRHVELPEVEFLAKRRTGLPSLYGASGAVTAAVPNASQPMRKAKIRKVDPNTGNITIYDAWIPEGQKIEGEVKDESQAAARQDVTVTKANPAPGTVIEGVGVANAEGIVVASTAVESPSKRKGPPPPKRKGKGLRGKGRKKVMFAPGEGAEVGGEAMDGEQDDDEEDDDGEEGEDAEEGEETVKTEELSAVEGTPQTTTPSTAPAPAPTMDIDSTPSLPPPAENSNVLSTQGSQTPGSPEKTAPIDVPEAPLSETPIVEPIKTRSPSPEKPRTPPQPQSEQLTPPVAPVTTIEANIPEIHDEMNLDPDVQDAEPIADVTSIQPNEDLMEDVQKTEASSLSVEPAAPVVENIEISETVQSAEEVAAVVQAEVKVEQTTDSIDQTPSTETPTAPTPSEPVVQPAPAVPEASPDLSDTLQSSLEKEPAPPAETVSETKIEQEEPNITATTATTTEVPPEPTAAPPPSEPILAPAQTEAEAEAKNQFEIEIAAPAAAVALEPALALEPVTLPTPVPVAADEPPAPPAPENILDEPQAANPPPAKDEVSSESAPQASADKAAESSDQPPQSS